MAGFGNCLRVLVDQLATAHRPTVPPSGERTVIIIIMAIAVIVFDHLFNFGTRPKVSVRLLARSGTVKTDYVEVRLVVGFGVFQI
jgi:hypothetical protein